MQYVQPSRPSIRRAALGTAVSVVPVQVPCVCIVVPSMLDATLPRECQQTPSTSILSAAVSYRMISTICRALPPHSSSSSTAVCTCMISYVPAPTVECTPDTQAKYTAVCHYSRHTNTAVRLQRVLLVVPLYGHLKPSTRW